MELSRTHGDSREEEMLDADGGARGTSTLRGGWVISSLGRYNERNIIQDRLCDSSPSSCSLVLLVSRAIASQWHTDFQWTLIAHAIPMMTVDFGIADPTACSALAALTNASEHFLDIVMITKIFPAIVP